MSENNSPRLCAAIFFNILLENKKQGASARDRYNGNSDVLSEPQLLAGLIRLFKPTFEIPAGRTFSTVTSNFKKCSPTNSEYLPFDDYEYINEFDRTVRNDYMSALLSMDQFIQKFINTDLIRCSSKLISTLLDVIIHDTSIDDMDIFFAGPNGQSYTKKELTTTTRIFFQPFLLGIWHYILMNRKDNTVGFDTLEWLINYYHLHSKISETEDDNLFARELTVEIFNIKPFVTSDSFDEQLSTRQLSGKPQYDYSTYIAKASEDKDCLKTMFYKNLGQPFYSFYICNKIRQKPLKTNPTMALAKVDKPTIPELRKKFSRQIIITGTGGLGKSMMLKHLLYDALDNYTDTKQIPFLIPLKDYIVKDQPILEFVYSIISTHCDITMEQLEDTLISGNAVFLFDALDEIHSSLIVSFEKQFNQFVSTYGDNMFILSSRPDGNFGPYNQFIETELLPFDKDQALALIDLLKFREDKKEIKQSFAKKLDDELFDTYNEFARNPLLLSIMLLTSESNPDFPKRYNFYKEAYAALSKEHDANKGSFRRELETKLSVERFSDYLAEFCMKTYHDEKYELTEAEFIKYYSQLKEATRNSSENATAQQFLDDLITNLCLMYLENNKYQFIHTSFQEYFCALFFSKQKDKTLGHIGEFFENNKGENAFQMLYDMIPTQVEEFIFKPVIIDIFKKCSSNDVYLSYLKLLHPTIHYDTGEVKESISNAPSSFIISFITKNILSIPVSDNVEFPIMFGNIENVYDKITDEMNNYKIIKHNPAFDENEDIANIEPQVGYNLYFNIEDAIDEPDILAIIENDTFFLKREYNELKRYLELLEQKQTPSSDNFFDLFE